MLFDNILSYYLFVKRSRIEIIYITCLISDLIKGDQEWDKSKMVDIV